ncbi:MAG: hypothetical protein WKF34_04210 [Pyrinomonadaceae bacterium]
MDEAKSLKEIRNLLLKLHKLMLDGERSLHERKFGALNSTQFLNLLLEDDEFAWLRKFSKLIVDIDEMFDLKDGISTEMITRETEKARDLVAMKDSDEKFQAKYQYALQHVVGAASLQGELKILLADNPPA